MTYMSDGRNFEWPESAVNVAKEMTFRYATVHEVMQFLLPYVKDALAAEYDRGYETAMFMERPVFDAWEVGYETAKKYYHDLWRWRNDGCPPGKKPERPRNPNG